MFRYAQGFALAAVLGCVGFAAQAQDGASVTGGAAPLAVQPSPSASLAFPSVFGVGSAVAAPSGTRFVALSYVSPREGISTKDDDGDVSFGFALGNPVSGVSAQVSVNILGLNPFAESGSVSASLSRMLRAGGTSATFASISAGNLLGWGDASGSEPTYVATLSHVQAFPLANGTELPMQFSFGYGSDTTLSDDGLGTRGPGAFFGVGMGLTETLAGSISFTRSQINMGFSLSIPQIEGAGLSLGVYDITDNTSRQQVSLGLSFAF
ncbi:hypothetical protein [Roseicyclus amphidinii]|jgi:hypothetical protein|uniref:hypothetical protein n=1 Tax=Roseicyclus amphidinii TaxID=3034232 RepID=UPI0024E04B90|nr:hypothetical protein [Roseicyclus sp. Amp-Y-6]